MKTSKARRVFGAALDDENSSLCYSPDASTKEDKRLSPVLEMNRDSSSSRSSSPRSTRSSTSSGPFEAIVATPGKENPNGQCSSPRLLDRDLVKKTQDALKRASISVNQSLNVSKPPSKTQQATASSRQSRIAEAKALNQRAERNRRLLLQLRGQVSSKGSQERARQALNEKANRIQHVDQEAQFKSLVYREHLKTLKQQQDECRRESIAIRTKLRANHRQGKEKLKLASMKEDQALYSERHESSIAIQNTKKANSNARRQSFVFRAGAARRIREIHNDLKTQEKQAEHESYELKWDGERDAEAYKRQLQAERRESLALRNMDARRQRLQALQEQTESWMRTHQSYELKRAASKDAEAYQQKVERLRRESLAARNKESVRHAKVMEELNRLARQQETESYILKWAGENDAKEYLAEQAEVEREHLRQRGHAIRQGRAVEQEQRSQELLQQHEDEELRSEDHRDVVAYRKKCAELDRKSLEYRRKDARMQRIEEEHRNVQQKQVEEQNFELETLARQDVAEYVKECKERRRQSLAFRAKERRGHVQWEKEQKEKEIEERSQLVHAQLMDHRSAQIAQEEERAKRALDALRHAAGYSLNAFDNVLNEHDFC